MIRVCRIMDDQVIGVAPEGAEAEGKGSQVLAHLPGQGRLGDPGAGFVDAVLHPVGGLVGGNIAPDFEKAGGRLRREPA